MGNNKLNQNITLVAIQLKSGKPLNELSLSVAEIEEALQYITIGEPVEQEEDFEMKS
jgi:hypothetical protein